MKKHLTIIVKGKVQGVGFRYHAKRMAENIGIKGFVSNMEDSSVYIEAEGDDDQLNLFREWCGRGPAAAMVSEMTIEKDEMKDFSQFVIEFSTVTNKGKQADKK
ncbi:MAG: acylphosphatase [Bacteroidia bacterium]|nr:acylphosphatase [Bacteroidia bacterium]